MKKPQWYRLLLLALLLVVYSCQVPDIKDISDVYNGAMIQIWIHDEPFRLSDKTVEHLYISVESIEIIREVDDERIVLSEEPKRMDILAIDANEPVLLSDTSVEPGVYSQLRLILSDNNTIVVDGEEHPINVPSGEQTGVKFDGPFELPNGRFFRFVLDFDAKESVIYNHGRGYMLKPVIHMIEVASEPVPSGIYRGMFNGFEAVAELRDDGTFRGISRADRRVEVYGDWEYDSVANEVRFYFKRAKCRGCGWFGTDVTRSMDQTAIFPTVSFTPNRIDLIDGSAFVRVSSYSLSAPSDPAILDVVIEVKDPELIGKLLAIKLMVRGSDNPYYLYTDVITANAHNTVEVPLDDQLFPQDNSAIAVILDTMIYETGSTDIFLEDEGYLRLLTFNPEGRIRGSIQSVQAIAPGQRKTIRTGYWAIFYIKDISPNEFNGTPHTITWSSYPGVAGYHIIMARPFNTVQYEKRLPASATSYTFTQDEYDTYTSNLPLNHYALFVFVIAYSSEYDTAIMENNEVMIRGTPGILWSHFKCLPSAE